MKRYYQYVNDVNSGLILACDALTKAISRFERDQAAAKKKGSRWTFDEDRPDKVIEFIERLVQFEEPFAGIPIHLEPWECFFIAQLYGWRNRKTGARRFRKALLFMARKQGKTILASAIILYEILSKPGIEAYSLATKQIIANKSFKNLERFISANDEIKSRLKINKSPRAIYVERNASTYMPLSSDCERDGLNPAVAHIDELSAQKSGDAYDKLTSGMGTRSEPLTLITSTAAASLENPLIAEYEYAKQILEGNVEDDAFLVCIYELDKADKWDDLSMMQKSCPNLGVTVFLDYFADELKRARMIPRRAVEYKTKYCNIWQSESATWIPDHTWTRCRKNARTFAGAFSDLSRLPCFLALDFSTIWDYTALTRYFYSSEADRYLAMHRFYIPAGKAEEKAATETPDIRQWITEGLIVATPGECIDYAYVYRDVDAALKAHKVLGIVYDPAKAKEFEALYESRAPLSPFRQNAAYMSPAAKTWEKAIVDGKICDDNPVLRWMLSNAINKANPDSGSFYITKNPVGRDRRRIDGVVTSLMAFSVLEAWVAEDSRPKPAMLDLSKIKY